MTTRRTNYPYPMLNPPSFRWNRPDPLPAEPKVHEWIRTLDLGEAVAPNWSDIDVTLLGVPLSRSSISASAASETPDALRRAWKYFATYNLDEEVDLSPPAGGRPGGRTATRDRHRRLPPEHSRGDGGDAGASSPHPAAGDGRRPLHHGHAGQGVEAGTPGGTDRHPATGHPLRPAQSGGSRPHQRNAHPQPDRKRHDPGEDVCNIGLHGFFNAKSLKEYADRAGVRYVTLKEARRRGVDKAVAEALDFLAGKVDTIYLTVDMDVLDTGVAPGAPASTPGGMRTEELFEAVRIAGTHPKVKAMDLVCLDPQRDVREVTVKAGVHTMLSFLTGFAQRKGL